MRDGKELCLSKLCDDNWRWIDFAMIHNYFPIILRRCSPNFLSQLIFLAYSQFRKFFELSCVRRKIHNTVA